MCNAVHVLPVLKFKPFREPGELLKFVPQRFIEGMTHKGIKRVCKVCEKEELVVLPRLKWCGVF